MASVVTGFLAPEVSFRGDRSLKEEVIGFVFCYGGVGGDDRFPLSLGLRMEAPPLSGSYVVCEVVICWQAGIPRLSRHPVVPRSPGDVGIGVRAACPQTLVVGVFGTSLSCFSFWVLEGVVEGVAGVLNCLPMCGALTSLGDWGRCSGLPHLWGARRSEGVKCGGWSELLSAGGRSACCC